MFIQTSHSRNQKSHQLPHQSDSRWIQTAFILQARSWRLNYLQTVAKPGSDEKQSDTVCWQTISEVSCHVNSCPTTGKGLQRDRHCTNTIFTHWYGEHKTNRGPDGKRVGPGVHSIKRSSGEASWQRNWKRCLTCTTGGPCAGKAQEIQTGEGCCTHPW